jgi:hypothetical protein
MGERSVLTKPRADRDPHSLEIRSRRRFEREGSPEQKLRKLEGFIVPYSLPLAEAVPLFAALLACPLPADYAPLMRSPE